MLPRVLRIACLALLFCSCKAANYVYRIVDIGMLPGDVGSSGTAINSKGDVTGYSFSFPNFQRRAFLFSQGILTNIGDLGGGSASAGGINFDGQISGFSLDKVSVYHAFIYSGGQMHSLDGPTPPVDRLSYGTAINASGQITGYASTSAYIQHAFLFSAGSFIDLGAFTNFPLSQGRSVNASGHVAGTASSQTAGQRAFLYTGGALQAIGSLSGGASSSAESINDADQIAGTANNALGLQVAYLYKGGALIPLGAFPGGSYSAGAGINNYTQVVGYATDGSGERAFLSFDGGPLLDLNTLIDPASGWALDRASAINDAAQITGDGIIGGVRHAYLLTPNLTITAESRPVSGHFQFQVLGVPNRTHTIQASSDLQGFTPIGTATADSSGHLTFDDPAAAGQTQRFYRVTLP